MSFKKLPSYYSISPRIYVSKKGFLKNIYLGILASPYIHLRIVRKQRLFKLTAVKPQYSHCLLSHKSLNFGRSMQSQTNILWILMFCKWQTPLHTSTHFYTRYRLPPPQTMLRGNGSAKRYTNFNYILNFTSRPQNQLHCCTVILNL